MESKISASPLRWGGLMETVENCENFSECTEETKTLFEKVHSLETSKNIPTLFHNLRTFTETERNYLNSPLLDQLHEISSTDTATSPVLECGRKNRPLALEFLLKIDPNLRKKNATFADACMYGHLEIVKILIKFIDFNTEYTYLPLKVASFCGDIKVVEFLLENLYKTNDHLYTALEYACQRGQENLAKVLIEKCKGKNLNLARPLATACEHGREDIVHLLLQNGADARSYTGVFYYPRIEDILREYSS